MTDNLQHQGMEQGTEKGSEQLAKLKYLHHNS